MCLLYIGHAHESVAIVRQIAAHVACLVNFHRIHIPHRGTYSIIDVLLQSAKAKHVIRGLYHSMHCSCDTN